MKESSSRLAPNDSLYKILTHSEIQPSYGHPAGMRVVCGIVKIKPIDRPVKSILCCAILLLPAAYGAPQKVSAKPAAAVPPKARVVAEPARKSKVHVSSSTASAAQKQKAAQAEKDTVPKVVAARPVASNSWRWIPKFQKTGKEDTTWGFLLKRPF
jgi:hypothetical protein